MSIFHWGEINLHSGGTSWWHIDCDDLTDTDIAVLARLIVERVGPCRSYVAPPSHPGSAALRLEEACTAWSLQSGPPYDIETAKRLPVCIVDDVLTTGASMTELAETIRAQGSEVVGAVIFARGKCPDWVTPLFQMPLVSRR
jgi:hypothetical protein